MKERGKNKQLAINLIASFITFFVGTAINFFLTPYIVSNLGAEAYGFVGLSNTIIGYAGLITISLNAMAGRFIALSYNKGYIEKANRYYSSVFYSNLFFAFINTIIFVYAIIYLEVLINIPTSLIWDIKLLFGLLALTNVLSLMTGVYGVATYIKNRLELSSIRTIVSQILRAVVLIIAFVFFLPHVWYIGLSGVICAYYVFQTNKILAKNLIPDLKVQISSFDISSVKELLSSGVWNLIVKIGDLLANGIDLLFANIFIGAEAMGVYSLTKTLPLMIQSLISSISSVFGPMMLQVYASGNMPELENEFHKSIRIIGFISAIPLSILYVLGREFYALWLPRQDASWLYVLTIAATSSMALWLPMEALWQIFTLQNKVKYASVAVLTNNGLTFLIALFAMLFIDSDEMRLLVLAGTKNTLKFLLSLTFLPITVASCLNTKRSSFYKPIMRVIGCFFLICVIGFIIKSFVLIKDWPTLILFFIIMGIISCSINYFIMLKRNDRFFIQEKVLHKIKKKCASGI